MSKRRKITDDQDPGDEYLEEEELESSAAEDADGESETEDEDESESSVEDPTPIELMVTKRERRANAGNKMASLLESTIQEDDFYASAYGGGFKEDDADDVYHSPAHSDGDEVDSDFDRPEEEDEPISDQEDKDRPRRSKRQGGYQEPARGSKAELLAKNKKWAVARMGGASVAANVCDAKTQAARLKEAEITEKHNIESLKKYEQFELERKKKREKAVNRSVPPPYISVRSKPEGKIVILPDIRSYPPAKKEPIPCCAVTGRVARYRDPLTGLPYSSTFAFKVIRDKYSKFLKTVKGNPKVNEYMNQFY